MTTAFRTGVGLPFGRVAGGPGNGMPEAYAYQVPIVLESGYRPMPSLLIGGYLGLAFGDVGGDLHRACSGCSTRTFRLGLEALVFLRPAERLDPWVGIGVGWESTVIVASDSSVDLSGPEVLHVLGGLDVRSSRTVGFGPYVDVSLGVYTSRFSQWRARSPVIGMDGPPRSQSEDVTGRALHGWATAGVRLVFYP